VCLSLTVLIGVLVMVLPADVLDIARWKVTLPVGSPGKPTELAGDKLRNVDSPWCKPTPDGGIAFAAPVNGVTTSGSKNPRAELRELDPATGKGAAWSGTKGTHIITVVEAFTRLPEGKPHVVGVQIHDSANDVTVFRLEGTKLYVTSGNDNHFKLIDSNYQLGSKFVAQYVVSGGKILAYYNGRLVAELPGNITDCYFKAGAYVQANCTEKNVPCRADNIGEVVVYSVRVEHTDKPPATLPQTPGPVVTPTPTPVPQPTAAAPIQIIRHGEKPDDKDNHQLAPKGWDRARLLPTLFELPRSDLYRPTYVFASKGNTRSERMVQTATPTAQALHLAIDDRYDVENAVTETAALLVRQARAGQTVLAVVEHSAIPALLHEIAELLRLAKVSEYKHGDGDWSTIHIFADGRYRKTDEGVLPGDPGYTAPPPPVTNPQPPKPVDPAPVEPPPVVTPPAPPEAPPPVPTTPAPTSPPPAPAPARSWWQRLLDWFDSYKL
jgi:hypothetical protein